MHGEKEYWSIFKQVATVTKLLKRAGHPEITRYHHQFIPDFPAGFAIRCRIQRTFKSQSKENVNNIQTEYIGVF